MRARASINADLDAIPMLTAGEAAPDFTAPVDDGSTLTLSSLRGHVVVLFFYPKDDTSG